VFGLQLAEGGHGAMVKSYLGHNMHAVVAKGGGRLHL